MDYRLLNFLKPNQYRYFQSNYSYWYQVYKCVYECVYVYQSFKTD